MEPRKWIVNCNALSFEAPHNSKNLHVLKFHLKMHLKQ